MTRVPGGGVGRSVRHVADIDFDPAFGYRTERRPARSHQGRLIYPRKYAWIIVSVRLPMLNTVQTNGDKKNNVPSYLTLRRRHILTNRSISVVRNESETLSPTTPPVLR